MGILIGTLIGAAGASGLISKEHFLSVSGMIMKLCFGAIVLLIDSLCIWALLRSTITNYIDKNGKKVIGKIENITVIPRPDQIGVDNWTQKARFAFIISYEAGSKKYNKEYSPTCLTSRQELYPQIIEVGKDIPIKYDKRVPYFSLIDVNVLKTGLNNEQKKARVYFVAIPIIITLIYIIAIMNSVI